MNQITRLTYKTESGIIFYKPQNGDKFVDFTSLGEHSQIILNHLAELEDKLENGLMVKLPCKVGDTVYRLCKCEDIPTQLDGTMYDFDGSPGTATGYYCPYEGCCPFETEFDTVECEDVKNKIGIFEDVVCNIQINEDETWIDFERVPCTEILDFGKTVFLTQAEAEAKLKEATNE